MSSIMRIRNGDILDLLSAECWSDPTGPTQPKRYSNSSTLAGPRSPRRSRQSNIDLRILLLPCRSESGRNAWPRHIHRSRRLVVFVHNQRRLEQTRLTTDLSVGK